MRITEILQNIDCELDGLYSHLYAIEDDCGRDKNIADLKEMIANLETERKNWT